MGSDRPVFAPQHLPYASAVAVAAVVGKPLWILGPRSEAVVGREGLRLPEASLLPATLVSRILAANTHPSGGSFTDHSTPPRRADPTNHHVNTIDSQMYGLNLIKTNKSYRTAIYSASGTGEQERLCLLVLFLCTKIRAASEKVREE